MHRILMALLLALVLSSSLALAADDSPVQLKDVAEQPGLCLKIKTSAEKIAQDIGQGYGRLFQYVAEKGIKPAGPPLALYYNPPGPEMDAELVVPVPPDTPGQGDIVFRELPGGSMASIIHTGPYETMKETYDILFAWIQKNNYRPVPPSREVYLLDPSMERDHSKLKTEVLMPVSK